MFSSNGKNITSGYALSMNQLTCAFQDEQLHACQLSCLFREVSTALFDVDSSDWTCAFTSALRGGTCLLLVLVLRSTSLRRFSDLILAKLGHEALITGTTRASNASSLSPNLARTCSMRPMAPSPRLVPDASLEAAARASASISCNEQ